ncbi:hypothetical protein SCANM63S_08275 [Streptomyces canarius]
MLRTVVRSVLRDRRPHPARPGRADRGRLRQRLPAVHRVPGPGRQRLQRASRPDVSVEVRPTGGGAAPGEALRRRLAALPGVAAARGTLRGPAFLVARDGTLVGPPSADAGVNFVPDAHGADPRYPMTRGRGPQGPGEIAVDRWSAERAGHRVGDRMRVVVAGEVRSVPAHRCLHRVRPRHRRRRHGHRVRRCHRTGLVRAGARPVRVGDPRPGSGWPAASAASRRTPRNHRRCSATQRRTGCPGSGCSAAALRKPQPLEPRPPHAVADHRHDGGPGPRVPGGRRGRRPPPGARARPAAAGRTGPGPPCRRSGGREGHR